MNVDYEFCLFWLKLPAARIYRLFLQFFSKQLVHRFFRVFHLLLWTKLSYAKYFIPVLLCKTKDL